MFHTFVEAERNISIWIDISSAIRQKGKSHQNECYKKTKHANFSEKETFLSSLRGKNCSFFRKLDMLCFLVMPVLRFTLLPFTDDFTTWKVSKYGIFSSPYFPAFTLNTERERDTLYGQFSGSVCLTLCLLENSELCRMNNLIE